MESIGLREFIGVGVPGTSGPDFTGVIVPWIFPSNVRGRDMELNAGSRDGQSGTQGGGTSLDSSPV
jgi:hypothetical protein